LINSRPVCVFNGEGAFKSNEILLLLLLLLLLSAMELSLGGSSPYTSNFMFYIIIGKLHVSVPLDRGRAFEWEFLK
jgi:hypothetical protein